MNTRTYDVAIMGGGPAGATLGAILARTTSLKVAIFERDFFPREHIGETFTHRVTSVLEESGALDKVLKSECWVKKLGGYYAWDPANPDTTLFDPEAYKRDGVMRWTFHVNRSEFDHILLEHARSVGVDVFEGVAVNGVERQGDTTTLQLGDGEEATCKIFVEAAGRQNRLLSGAKRGFLSFYKNIAIWNHVVGGKPGQSLAGEWNIFREKDLSAIGNFMFEDGWFWYIPVPKMVMGKRTLTHSLGLVTDPEILKDPAKRYTDPSVLMAKAKTLPLLGELLKDAQPVSDKVLTATNYSMISDQFCNLDEGWILIGDSAYFVDPLFSSGVAFGMSHAASAAALIKATFDGGLPCTLKHELWNDYQEGWRAIARSFALAIDQWYHAICDNHPGSVYWGRRGKTEKAGNLREAAFHALVDSGVNPDMLQVIDNRGREAGAAPDETTVEALGLVRDLEPLADDVLVIDPELAIKDSVTLDIGRPKATQSVRKEDPVDVAAARYWLDPIAGANDVAAHYPGPRACQRFYYPGLPERPQVRFEDAVHGGRALRELLLPGPQQYGELAPRLTGGQRRLLSSLCRAGMVTIRRSEHAVRGKALEGDRTFPAGW